MPYWFEPTTVSFEVGGKEMTLETGLIDGASGSQLLTRIIIPILRPIILFVLIADTIINFTLFVPVQLLTQGGPQLSTNLVMYETYRRGFIYGDLGTAAVMLTAMLLVILVIIGLQYNFLRAR